MEEKNELPSAFQKRNDNRIDYSPYKVLLVEDASSIRMVEKALLKEMGFTSITEAGSSKVASREISTNDFDLVLCDWELPDGEGIALLEQLRAKPGQEKTPFLMVTSNSQIERVKKAIALGVTDYIAKPFEQQVFCSRIQKAMLKSGKVK